MMVLNQFLRESVEQLYQNPFFGASIWDITQSDSGIPMIRHCSALSSLSYAKASLKQVEANQD